MLTRLFLRGLSLHAFAGLAALLCTFLCSPEPLGPGMLSPWQGWAGTRSIVIFPSVLYSSVRVPGPSMALGTAPMAELVPALLLLAKNHHSHWVWLQASEQQGHGERESAAGWGWRGSKHAPSCLTSAWEGVDEHGGISAAMRQERWRGLKDISQELEDISAGQGRKLLGLVEEPRDTCVTPCAHPAAAVSLGQQGEAAFLSEGSGKSRRGQFLCYPSPGKPLWISASSVLTLVPLAFSTRDDNSGAPASQEGRGWQHTGQDIPGDLSTASPGLPLLPSGHGDKDSLVPRVTGAGAVLHLLTGG